MIYYAVQLDCRIFGLVTIKEQYVNDDEFKDVMENCVAAGEALLVTFRRRKASSRWACSLVWPMPLCDLDTWCSLMSSNHNAWKAVNNLQSYCMLPS